MLTDLEKHAIRDGDEPHPGNYPPQFETDPCYRFQLELYELAWGKEG